MNKRKTEVCFFEGCGESCHPPSDPEHMLPACHAHCKQPSRFITATRGERPMKGPAANEKLSAAYYEQLVALTGKVKLVAPPPIKSKNETLVQVVSDLHYGKIIRAGSTELYNATIARERVSLLGRNMLDLAKNYISKSTKIDEVVFALVGDIIDGDTIWDAQAHSVEMPAFDQMREVTALLWDMFLSVLREMPSVKRVRVEAVPGNHGNIKVLNSPKINNWDNIVYHGLSLLAQHDRAISVNYSPYVFHNFRIRNQNWHMRHIGPKGAATPAQQKKLTAWRLKHRADVLVFGHFHHGSYDDHFGPNLWNGCFCGPDDLSEEMGVDASPAQWLIGVNDKRITFKYEVDFR